MKLAILAGEARLAPLLVREALGHGHVVSLLGAAPEGLVAGGEGLRLVPGDQRDAGAVSDLIDGQEAVLVALADGSDASGLAAAPDVTLDAVRSMSRYGVRRFVVLSASAVTPGGEPGRPGLLGRLLDPLARRDAVADLRRMEVAVRRSELEWTIVRAARLADEPPRGLSRIRVGPGYSLPDGRPISRADVAAFLVAELADGRHVGHAVAISA
jgi:hypothetical protein